MRASTLSLPFIAISLISCTNTDNPQLAMCQAVAQQLTNNTVSSWDSDSSDSSDRQMTVKVAFTNSSGQANSLKCQYPKQENGTIDTAPSQVVMNNQKVDQSVLLSAGTRASKELLAGTYKNTVAKTTELANQAQEKAGELAVKAGEAATEGAKALQQLQQQ